MQLEIRNYYSADIDELPVWVPNERNEVYFHLEFEVAELGRREANVFQVDVATPNGLSWFVREFKCPFPDRAVIILDEYSWQSVVNRLEAILDKCTRETWQQSIDQLRLFFAWEYEDMREI